MTERSFGHVATVRIDSAWAAGPQYFGLVLTDRRTIFVHQFTDKTALGGAALGAVGAVIASSLQRKPRDPIEYANEDLDRLAAEEKSIVVNHAAVGHWKLKKQLLDDIFDLVIDYRDGRKRRKLKATLTWVRDVENKLARSGQRRREMAREQARAVQMAYSRALPEPMPARFQGIT